LLGAFFLPFANFATIDDDVVLAGNTVDPDSAERKVIDAHVHLPAWCSHALF
jgi:predicted hotdog family 3-hydroxylacyl-ACP dehydratase